MLSLSIRSRLILLFTGQMLIIILLGGIYLDWRARRILEEELSSKLIGLAQASALQFQGELLESLTPGDENTRTHRNLSGQLHKLRSNTAVRRLYCFSEDKKSILDTRQEVSIGSSYPFLPVTDGEIEDLFTGAVTASPLFQGADGNLYKTGFAPIRTGDRIVAIMAVEGSAETLEAVATMRNDLVVLGALMLSGSVLLGILFAKQITIPIDRLKQAALKITRGRFETPIQPLSGDELGFLAHTMEDMRQAIVQRDIRHKAMLAGVAHEIRNPLGGIELFAGLLASEVEGPEAKQHAKKIQQEVRNLNRIVSDFIDYARPNKAQRSAVVLKEVIEDVESVLQPVTGSVKIVNELDSQTCVNADPQHMRQVFLNLFQNALEANEAQDKQIFISGQKDRFQQHIFVRDNGPGIPDERVQQIFEPFYTSKKEGTGLGLAIVQSLLHENNGSILLEQPAQAKFRITLESVAPNLINQS